MKSCLVQALYRMRFDVWHFGWCTISYVVRLAEILGCHNRASPHLCQNRTYKSDSTRTRLISEVKQILACLVHRWETTMESWVLILLCFARHAYLPSTRCHFSQRRHHSKCFLHYTHILRYGRGVSQAQTW